MTIQELFHGISSSLDADDGWFVTCDKARAELLAAMSVGFNDDLDCDRITAAIEHLIYRINTLESTIEKLGGQTNQSAVGACNRAVDPDGSSATHQPGPSPRERRAGRPRCEPSQSNTNEGAKA